MQFENVYIPYAAYWSTPFCKWQGSFANLHSIRFAAEVTRRALAERGLDPRLFDALYLGNTVPAPNSFYGAPWLAGLIGAPEITGPTISQACATSARLIGEAAFRVETGASDDGGEAILGITADRTSNGPHLLYPNPLNPGGRGDAEDWVWDNFNCDPLGRNSMLETAENVARLAEITTEEQHDAVLMRHAQYQDALAGGAAFHKRYMVTPVEVNPTGRKVLGTVSDDEGVFPTIAEGLAKLKPVLKDGSVTYGAQTYPADGSAGMVITTRERARAMSRRPEIEVQILSFAEGRAKQGYMPMANLPAAQKALNLAGVTLQDLKAIKTHNPFAVNDVYLSRELGVPLDSMNHYGSSLIWGHPQGPTGMRLIIELIEELEMRGGGYGLFTGCAAGDTAAAVVVRVG